jgi:hypothetical protein
VTAQDAATMAASTKRPPAASGGKVSQPVTHLVGLLIVPPLPADREMVEQAELRNPREAKVTYIFPTGAALPDVVEGDLLVVGSTEYLINLVKEWPRTNDSSFLEVLMTQRKVAA